MKHHITNGHMFLFVLCLLALTLGNIFLVHKRVNTPSPYVIAVHPITPQVEAACKADDNCMGVTDIDNIEGGY